MIKALKRFHIPLYNDALMIESRMENQDLNYIKREAEVFIFLCDEYSQSFAHVPGLEDPDQLPLDKAWGSMQRYGIDDVALLKRVIPTIVRNAIIDEQRKNERYPTEEWPYSPNDSEDISDMDIAFRSTDSVEDILLQQEALQEIYDIVMQVCPLFREPLILRVWGYTQEQIAEALQIPVGTVKSRVNRGRQAAQQIREGKNNITAT